MSNSNDGGYGMLELDQMITDEIDAMSGVVVNMTTFTADLGKSLRDRTTDLTPFTVMTIPPGRIRQVQQRAMSIMNRAAADITRYSDRMEAELPKYEMHSEKAADLLAQFVKLYKELGSAASDDFKKRMYVMISSTEEAIENLKGMLASTQKLPSMTADLIRARHRAEKTILQTMSTWDDSKVLFQIALLDLD